MHVLKRGGYALQMWGRHMHVLKRRGYVLRMGSGHMPVLKRNGAVLRKKGDGGGHIEEGAEGKGIDGWVESGKRDTGTPAGVHQGVDCCRKVDEGAWVEVGNGRKRGDGRKGRHAQGGNAGHGDEDVHIDLDRAPASCAAEDDTDPLGYRSHEDT